MVARRSPHAARGNRARRSAVRLLAIVIGLGVSISLGLAGGSAHAQKVGVAAAVNPDAFSGAGGARKQLTIGKSIFYNERISTDASGVVQVLLVDGSTFTVGKNSDLVIDRFVYDPRKDTGEIVTTFSKGTMRYIGGKISKNVGGVTVKTPDGSLAIRGGMVQGSTGVGPSIFSFLFGEELTFTGGNGRTYTVYQPGYTLDLSGGAPTIRETTPEDIQLLMASLTNSAITTTSPQVDPPVQPPILAETLNLQQLIADATATRIDDELLRQLQALQDTSDTPDIRSTLGGFGAGLVSSSYGYGYDFGFAASTSPNDYTFDESTGIVTLTLRDIEGGSVNRGVFEFNAGGNPAANLLNVSLFAQGGQPLEVVSSSGFIVAEPGPLCSQCDFIEWGEFGATFEYLAGGQKTITDQIGLGWWVAGNVTDPRDLPITGTATYKGTAVGSIALSGAMSTVTGRGDLNMSWDFAQRRGTLAINNFDVAGGNTPLNASGTMIMPGGVNRLSGNLSGAVGRSAVNGGAVGAIVKNGNDPRAGVIGNWGVSGAGGYMATGVFAGRR